ncbi:nudix hydrolase 13, mitochondrial isoform X2 [Oryza sativa Japonica Group]|uniref:nudix hydrolase 13, mitochondrial isoform X2 n=1 Tax=Oryza sativa subsp. japonica TaxID=39947 RepID=UPI0007753763|nr:nudix hydrolase 13, mitochondrial isoform X2 [Oryza sativa Japonica Group]
MKKSWSCSWICPLEVIVQIRKLFFSSKEKMAPSSPPAMNMACARQGRLRQRYEGCYRLVSGCIPYMIKEDGENSSSSLQDDDHVLERLQVLMISTPKRSDLIFPKGGWEDDESIGEAACREAFEEAGVKGVLSGTPLGEWIFKSKSKQNSCGLQGACKGYMFALQVTELLESWPEQTTHGRRWNFRCRLRRRTASAGTTGCEKRWTSSRSSSCSPPAMTSAPRRRRSWTRRPACTW